MAMKFDVQEGLPILRVGCKSNCEIYSQMVHTMIQINLGVFREKILELEPQHRKE